MNRQSVSCKQHAISRQGFRQKRLKLTEIALAGIESINPQSLGWHLWQCTLDAWHFTWGSFSNKKKTWVKKKDIKTGVEKWLLTWNFSSPILFLSMKKKHYYQDNRRAEVLFLAYGYFLKPYTGPWKESARTAVDGRISYGHAVAGERKKKNSDVCPHYGN